jgi:hypothetical protein
LDFLVPGAAAEREERVSTRQRGREPRAEQKMYALTNDLVPVPWVVAVINTKHDILILPALQNGEVVVICQVVHTGLGHSSLFKFPDDMLGHIGNFFLFQRAHLDSHSILTGTAVLGHLNDSTLDTTLEDDTAIAFLGVICAHHLRTLATFMDLWIAVKQFPVRTIALVQGSDILLRTRHDVPSKTVLVRVIVTRGPAFASEGIVYLNLKSLFVRIENLFVVREDILEWDGKCLVPDFETGGFAAKAGKLFHSV